MSMEAQCLRLCRWSSSELYGWSLRHRRSRPSFLYASAAPIVSIVRLVLQGAPSHEFRFRSPLSRFHAVAGFPHSSANGIPLRREA